MGSEQEHVLGEACPRGQERIELAGLLKLIESSEGDEDLLASFAVLAGVLDDLEVLPGSGLFDAEEHGGLLQRDTAMIPRQLAISSRIPRQISTNVAPHFGDGTRKK